MKTLFDYLVAVNGGFSKVKIFFCFVNYRLYEVFYLELKRNRNIAFRNTKPRRD